MFSAITASGPLVKAGKLRAIAVATAFDRRIESMPQLPTVAESGLAGFSAHEWNGVWATAATPPEIVKRLEAEWRDTLASSAVCQRLGELGALPATGGARELGEFVQADTVKWAGVIQASNIKAD